jgi:oxygen-independent coproporphyrinogen-3 oxidase
MGGIYIHIPFCRQACRYCDFYFSVSLKYLDKFVDVLVEEIRLKGETSPGRSLESLYLGGGTPSILSTNHRDKIISAIHRYHSFVEHSEWTIECNPDDLNPGLIKKLLETGFNRLSIGVQSFHEKDLEIMRRSHNAGQAETSVRLASSGGFDLISMDLIYGIPGQSLSEWDENIDLALSLPVSHLSAYHLTFEPGTVFDHWRKQGRLAPPPEEESLEQYRILRDKMRVAGFDHYELSNFGREGEVSKHNMLYWSGKPYLGLGPSAHSFDGDRRSWNVSSLKTYMELLASGKEICQTEELTVHERYHDYLITSLRTRWGVDPDHIEHSFGAQYRSHFEKQAQVFIESGSMLNASGSLIIEPGQWMITDHILRALFMA